ncbi:MAG TPA: hypothetical protein VMV18_14545, partial [bacterium]|nr:hypothetical protein [bacterium]
MRILPAAVLLLLATPAFAAAPKVGDAAPPLDVKDVKDRPLKVPETGSVLVLSFASKSNAEEMGAVTRALRAQHPDAKVYSFIDLSGFPSWLR